MNPPNKIDSTFTRLAKISKKKADLDSKAGQNTLDANTTTQVDSENRIKQLLNNELKNIDLSSSHGKQQARQLFFEIVLANQLNHINISKKGQEYIVSKLESQFASRPTLEANLDKLLIRLSQRDTR